MIKRILLLSALIFLFVIGIVPNGSNAPIHATASSSTSIHLVAKISAGRGPQFLAYDPFNKLVYVANFDNGGGYARDTISVINGTRNIANITVGGSPTGIIYNPSNHEVYVANKPPNYGPHGGVSVINGVKLVKTILANYGAEYLVYNPSDKLVYVTVGFGLAVINSSINSIVAKLNLTYGQYYSNLVYDASNHEVYVSYMTHSVGVVAIKGTKIVANVSIPIGSAGWLTYNPSNKCIYVSDNQGQFVYAIDGTTNKIIAAIKIGYASWSATYDPANHDIYVSLNAGNYVTAISNTSKIVAKVQVGPNPLYFSYDSSNKDLYVTINNSVVAINPSNAVVATVKIPYGSYFGSFPEGIVYDPANTYVYAADFGDNTVSVISS